MVKGRRGNKTIICCLCPSPSYSYYDQLSAMENKLPISESQVSVCVCVCVVIIVMYIMCITSLWWVEAHDCQLKLNSDL